MARLRAVCVAALTLLAYFVQPAIGQDRPRTLSGRYWAPVDGAACGPATCLASTAAQIFIHAMEVDGARVDALFLRPAGFGLAGFYAIPKTPRERFTCLVGPCCSNEMHFAAIIAEGSPATEDELLEIIAMVTPNLRWPDQTGPKIIDIAARTLSIGFVVREVCEGRRINKRINLDPTQVDRFFAYLFPNVFRLLRQP